MREAHRGPDHSSSADWRRWEGGRVGPEPHC